MKSIYVLGIIGGISGIVGGLFAVLFGTAFGFMEEASSILLQGWVAIAASSIAIIAATQVESHSKRSGGLLIVSGIVGLVAISFFYILPAILLVVGGITALSKASGIDS